ncbi:GumC family protein [Puniceibacterium confluentis]|uniref:GumC family protein n=1 Tax=Puniceibacterium confluentis TaxID=1958944 RepID=UPI001FECC8CF|nr:polysaccharide biosynthesis tyrosine autokinase [Puniceibacterium confluentis]
MSDQESLDIFSLLQVLWRNKLWILLSAALGVLMAGYYAYMLAVPTYTARAVVMLNSRQETVVDIQSVVSGLGADTSVVNTEVEVLRSRTLMTKVVEKLDLTSDPEFNLLLSEPSLIDKLQAQVLGYLGIENGNVQVLPEMEAKQEVDGTVSQLLQKLSVVNVPQSLVFQIVVTTENPVKSSTIADMIVDQYILDQIEAKYNATEQATSWLAERVSQLQARLENAEEQVNEFRANTELLTPEGIAAQERQLSDLRERITNTEALLETTGERLSRLEAAQTPQERAAAADDAQLKALLPRIGDPSIRSSIESRFQQIVARAELEAGRARSQFETLHASARDVATMLDQQGKDQIRFQQLERESEAARLLYQYFLTRLNETAAQQGIHQADSRPLSFAVIPNGASTPKKAMLLAVGLVIGCMMGSVIVLVLELRNDSIRTGRDLEAGTGYPVLAQVPQVPVKGRIATARYFSENPTSAAAEAVRNLRTSLMFSNMDRSPEVIMVCSAVANEGKTTLTLALAQNFGAMGKRVLLVDGDIRRRTLTEYTPSVGREKTGLLAVLSGDASLEDTVVRNEYSGVDILLGEKTTANAADIFASNRFGEFIKSAREKYDLVLIDTPPVLIVPDARIISQSVDAVVLAVRWDATSLDQVTESLSLFETVNARVAGLALTQVNTRRMQHYGYDYQHYNKNEYYTN